MRLTGLTRLTGLALAAVCLASRGTPAARLSVRGADGRWRTWWTAGAAPAAWTAPNASRAGAALAGAALAGAARWRAVRPGLEMTELSVAADLGVALPAHRVQVVVARVDPSRYALALHAAALPNGGAGPWDLGRAPADAALAVNAGQFTDAGPWGWVVHRGRTVQPPGIGPLSAALVVDDRGRARVVPADSIATVTGVVEAVQSYPMLLDGDGAVPDALRAEGRGVDLAHRDARLAVCELRDGRLLFALTRFAGVPGDALGALPLGLTVPETAALMGALGCRRAVMLDGGLSAQMLVRDAAGGARRWDGLRRVPLGLIAVARP
jgi:hypothetical protein